jgi:hypothetical protein
MAKRDKLDHAAGRPFVVRLKASGYDAKSAAENISAGYHTLAEAFSGWRDSPPHRANILNPRFDSAGIGVAQRGERLWIVQNFALRMAEMPDAQAEKVIAAAATRLRTDLREVRDNRLRRLACGMAQAGRLESEPALALPSARSVAAYTSLNPRELPKDARRLLSLPTASQLGVGACFARTPKYPSGVYWVVMVLYGGR